MKTKVFETGAVCAAVALLVVFSLPAYAKNGRSSSAHTRVSKTPLNAPLVKPVTSSRKTQSGTLQKSGTAANKTKKEADALKPQLGNVQNDTKELLQKMENKRGQETDTADRIKGQQDKSGSIQKNLDAAAERSREMGNTINCLANC